ncbi:origin recognition complex subunit 2-domain-containing protein [Sordaria brevicollis]|uniref:Origin recognition complex subunit 2 n=1 Tax=Sordaria brevicollis TaxID=83679 RepID=A0AAE0PN78_SORBR|nr:origin recognition complex subunit 2-domain-containing protein [Sordaria brevicollis]
MPPRRKSDQHELVERPSRKRSLPADDPYEVPDEDDAIPSAKRQRRQSQDGGGTPLRRNGTPRKNVDFLHSDLASVPEEPESPTEQTPSKKRIGRPPKAATGGSPSKKLTTPSALRKEYVEDVTPIKLKGLNGVDTPSRRGIADRSARRKSARALIDRVLEGGLSDDEDEEQQIAREIYESSEEEDENDENIPRESLEDQEEEIAATTPSKTGRGSRGGRGGGRGRGRGRGGRPPGSGRQRKKSPTPPADLPPHEQYFYQNKPGASKTSNNTLSATLDLLTHEEYFSLLRDEHSLQQDPHEEQIQALQSHHSASFPQWAFELSQGFSVCLYGYGSKRKLLHQFAEFLSSSSSSAPSESKIIMINGHHRTLTIREILTTISSAIDPSFRLPSGNPLSMIQNLFSLFSSHTTQLYLLFSSLDSPLSPHLRKPATQSLLAHLSSHPSISLCCTVDTPDFPLLWDSSLRSSFNFAFHDCTTFAPFSSSSSSSGATDFDVVDQVHELLGRLGKRAGGKEGVAFVLRSLPENARKLFGLIVGEVLIAFEDATGAEEFVGGGGESPGVEYRMLYNKAVEEFICSSEMAFRTLLKEFHDHQIITSHKDSIGTEYLSLPFRKEELESILEELMS